MAANSSMEFQPGDEVELAIAAEGFENSYYPVTVISKVEGSSATYRVRYKTLLSEDGSVPLEEFAEGRHLRPTPPDVPVNCFSLYELADVWENDGWWTGIVYGNFRSKYFLFHPETEEEKPYNLEQLRVHQEWINGQWIRGRPESTPSPEKKKKQRRSKKPECQESTPSADKKKKRRRSKKPKGEKRAKRESTPSPEKKKKRKGSKKPKGEKRAKRAKTQRDTAP